MLPQDDYPFTEEAQLARSGQITYKQAFHAIYNRRNAFSTANPFSARVLGEGQAFLSRQNIVCLLEGYTLHIFDTALQRKINTLHLARLAGPSLEGQVDLFEAAFEINLLNYSHGIVVLHFTTENRGDQGYVYAIRVGCETAEEERVVQWFRPASSSKLFVRHNATHLCYGTHSGIGTDGHHKWEISLVTLDSKFQSPEKGRTILLENFHGTDVGSTVAFEIHNDHFYAVSNQGTFEVEEIDFTSFYHYICFPLDDPNPERIEKNDQLYRRQHKEGPIHDSWTDLTLQVDERTNEIVIVESRREWAQSSSRQSRTFYITKLEPASNEEQILPMDDDFVALNVLDSSNHPRYKPTPDRYSWSQHPEFPKGNPNARNFILARTKFRGYNYSCSSFLDLVEDDQCCSNNDDPYKPPCLRLRIGSRRQYIPYTSSHNHGKGEQRERNDNDDIATTKSLTTPQFIDKTTIYHHPPVRMWPPAPATHSPCSAQLHRILNPPLAPNNGSGAPSQARSITGVLDEHKLVYLVKPAHGYGNFTSTAAAAARGGMGTLVLVNFSKPPELLLPSVPTPPASSLTPPALSWYRKHSVEKCSCHLSSTDT